MNDSEPTPAPPEAVSPSSTADATGPAAAPAPPEPAPCPQCQAPRAADAGYCADCGYIFAEPAAATTTEVPAGPVGSRFKLTAVIGQRGDVVRFRGEDVGTSDDPIPVIVVRQAGAAAPPSEPAETSTGPRESSEFDFNLDEVPEQATEQLSNAVVDAAWPSVGWEQGVLLRAAHLSLPRLIDAFTEDGFNYLVEEVPSGTPLWDAWDSEGVTNRMRFSWLIQIAEALERLHFAGAIVEGLRPEMVVVSPTGIAILADLTDLLPLPLPADVPLRGGFATAPELLLNPAEVDERADVYTFGALTYALLLGRELSELDFTLTGMPLPFIERIPGASPFLTRLMAKTFVRDPALRFPTADGSIADPTGFRELIRALDACRHNLDRVRVDVTAWSSTGIIRNGNEDAVAVFHAGEGRLEHADEAALILLADGMGGMESGEVAAALTLQTVRQWMFAAPPFGPALPATPPPEDLSPGTVADEQPAAETQPPASPTPTFPPLIPVEPDSPERTPDAHGERILAALREANRRVFETARAHPGARGMGCTAEVVLIDGGTAVIGHVGDSRVYRMRRGKLSQVTQDQTIVGRMVQLGQLTEKEAESHPRRSELQQAIGGRADVYPDIYSVTLEPGDWLLVCSDGLSNQAPLTVMQSVLREAKTAEGAARRLVNMVLADGAMDNVSVAVVRIA